MRDSTILQIRSSSDTARFKKVYLLVLDETTAKGYEPATVARRILSAVLRNESEVMISDLTPRVVILLRTLMPSIYFYLMRNRALRLKS